MSTHFAFVAPPAHGHVNPTLPLVSELVRRGHRVTYATGQEQVAAVEAAGARPLPLPMRLPTPPSSMTDIAPEHLAMMLRFFLDDARAAFPLLHEHFAADPPEAVCFDMMTFTGRMLAEKLDAPDVALVPNFAANERFSLHETFMPASFDLQHPELVRVGEDLDAFAAQQGVSRPESMFSATPASLNLVFIPERFQLAAETFDERFRFLGPTVGMRASEPFEPADPDAPLLLISLGTAFNNRPDFYRTCLRAFADSDWQVVMAIGSAVDRAELGEIPANIDVQEHVPQPAVLDRATAFLSHAGMNSTMESLYYGVPLVTFPQMPEQRANASRAEELGLGRVLEPEVGAAELRKTVDDVAADPHMRANLDEMREQLCAGGGAVAGADALEQHLS